ncbi:MAG: YciI-like protein [Bacteroidota bacterium]
MNYYVLLYHLVPDYVTRRTQFREEHLCLANEAVSRGELLLGGAFSDPADISLLIFRVSNPTVIEHFVKKDPYYRNGIVEKFEIRPWTVVVGSDKK